MLFCKHSSSDNGLFIGKLETDVLGYDIVNECVPKQGNSFKNTKFIVIDSGKREAWLLDDERIYFNVIRRNGSSHKPNIIIANSHYKKVFYNDYIDIIKYRDDDDELISNIIA